MLIVSLGDNLHEVPKPIFRKKNKKKKCHEFVVCWICPESCKGSIILQVVCKHTAKVLIVSAVCAGPSLLEYHALKISFTWHDIHLNVVVVCLFFFFLFCFSFVVVVGLYQIFFTLWLLSRQSFRHFIPGRQLLWHCLLSFTSSPFWKRDLLWKKRICPKVSKFLAFRIDPFL